MKQVLKTAPRKLTSLLAVVGALVSASPAAAALLDHGPQDPVLVFPLWYRDTNGLAVGLCKSQVNSPNGVVGPMCFPLVPNPAGFPGNIGDEVFYNNLTVRIGANPFGSVTSFGFRYVAGLEAAYTTAFPVGAPVHGNETVFARIRFVMAIQTPGTYTVTHPFGIQVFPDVQATGPRAVFFTADVPLGTPMNFNGALLGNVGPFIQWDTGLITVGAEQFLGDPNIDHAYTGSPFGTNFIRIDGPPGSGIGGLDANGVPIDSVTSIVGGVEGQRWTAPIATNFSIQKAVYSSSLAGNTVDVWATAPAAQTLILTGTDMPSIQLAEFPGGNYYGHLEYPSLLIPPATVNVTNMSSNPVNTLTIGLVDQLDALANYARNPLTGTGALTMTATSSDLSSPRLTVVAPFGGPMLTTTTPGAYTFAATVPAGTEPPMSVRVESNAGGVYLANVVVGAGAPMNAATGRPVAVNDVAPLPLSGAASTTITVTSNDTYASPVKVLVLTQPTTGTAVADPAGIVGIVTFTPTPGASGADSFTYALQDAGGVSNVATVSFTVAFSAPPPTANADNFAMLAGTVTAPSSRTYNVIANDVAGVGTAIDPASIAITQGAGGTATTVGAPLGSVIYTPAPGTAGIKTFSYTVKNGAGVPSAPATVTVDVFGGPEAVSFSKNQYTVAQQKWTIVGSTNWFNAALTQTTATCWIGTLNAPVPGGALGTVLVDITGKFALIPAPSAMAPTNPSNITCQTSNGGWKTTGVTFK
jgi:hypothetical protein